MNTISYLLLGILLLISKLHSDEPKHFSRTKTIVLAIDGVPYSSFLWMQKKHGLYRDFIYTIPHVAPFPSLSDHAWNKITRSQSVYGKAGRIQSYEATYYDSGKNILVNDQRDYFTRINQPNLYMGAFQYFLNPFLESLLYFPTKEVAGLEIDHIKQRLIESDTQSLASAFIVSTDSVAHTQKDELLNLHRKIDLMLHEVLAYYHTRGIDLRMVLISDHGMGAGFIEGEEEIPLQEVDILQLVREAGFVPSDTLKEEQDVVVPILALASSVGFHFKNLTKRVLFKQFLMAQTWLDLGVYQIEKHGQVFKLQVFDQQQEGVLEVQKDTQGQWLYRYHSIDGSNLFSLPAEMIGQWIADAHIRKINFSHPLSDSLFRLADAVSQEEADFPDLLVSLKDQYCLKGPLSQYVKMYRTHGSLSKNASTGIVSSNRPLGQQQFLRSQEILPFIGVTAQELFQLNRPNSLAPMNDQLKMVENYLATAIPTEHLSTSDKYLFGILEKILRHSKYTFDSTTIKEIYSYFFQNRDSITAGGPITLSAFPLEQIDTQDVLSPSRIGILTDLILRYQDWEKIKHTKEFQELKRSLNFNHDSLRATDTQIAKKMIMKSHSLNYFLENAFNIPEFSQMAETRDLNFFQDWLETKKDAIENPENFSGQIKTLFQEIFKETKLQAFLNPTDLPLLYPANKNSSNITIVYLPGIYNSIFDDEIFRAGLDALKYQYGIPILVPPLLSACSSDYNGKILIEFLRNHASSTWERRGEIPHYFLVGYSKGGIDALTAFVQEPNFIREHVLGLLTIASPLHGSEILQKSDLPISLLEMLSPEEIPPICQSTESASSSLTPNHMSIFWRENTKKLLGLTRYFSLSFRSSIMDSHLWMKATKKIANFTSENDGVVTVQSSKFPGPLQAVDFGEIEGDHLAGIVASHFPQEAFFSAIFLTLEQLQAFDPSLGKIMNQKIHYQSPLVSAQDHQSIVKEKIAGDLSNTDLAAVIEKLRQQLIATPYKLKDFSTYQDSKGGLWLRYSRPISGWRRLFMRQQRIDVPIENLDQALKIFLGELQLSEKDLTQNHADLWQVIPVSPRAPFLLPPNNLNFTPNLVINLRKMKDSLAQKEVTPFNPIQYPSGIKIVFDHEHMIDFRQEYQFSYEDTSGLAPDDNPINGWLPVMLEDGEVYAKLQGRQSSIRLTSFAFRFRPKDFPILKLSLRVDQGVSGANVLFGGNGKDDSAFQVWLTLRVLGRPSPEIVLFGFYWGDKIDGLELKNQAIYENYYSKKNYLFVTLPEAKQLLLDHGTTNLGKKQTFTRSLYQDLQTAFPNINPDDLEVIGITFQHDSNDTQASSLAYFQSLLFLSDNLTAIK